MTPAETDVVASLELGLDEVLDLLPLGACVISRDLTIHAWNLTLARWTRIAKATAIGSNLGQRYPNLLDRRYGERLEQVFASGNPAVYSAALHRHFLPIPAKHARTGELMIQKTQIRLLSNTPPRALLVIEDVTTEYERLAELRTAKQSLQTLITNVQHANHQLARKNAELDDFTYAASHDLQEPLRKIVSFGKLLSVDLGGHLPEKAAADLDFITDAAQRMQILVQDLLKLSRAGRAAMKHESVSLADCADRALEALSMRIEETAARITRDELPCGTGDATLLTQLYQNLISNALKFVAPDRHPVIQLTAEHADGQWVLGVRDNGIGIKPEYAEQVFAPFKRLHSRTRYEGTGIGLAICRKTVERHGGKIWVESQAGQGAHFKFTINANPETSEWEGDMAGQRLSCS